MTLLFAASAPLLFVHAVAAAIWIGGLVAIFVVARAASATLEDRDRIAFFRALGRAYGVVGGVALLIALGSGAILLAHRPWDGLMIATTVAAAALLAATAAGVVQARAMTRLRRRALEGGGLERQVGRGAVVAGALRGAIGVLTLALVALGAALVA